MIKLTLVVGARPNFMKISPIIRVIDEINSKNKKITYRLIHTGQHYDKIMSDDFFEQLNIPKPNVNLNCQGNTQTEQTSSIMIEFEKELLSNKPDFVIVVGDVNSTMACSIVAKKLQLKVVHIEAGIRSFDRSMPEEINRLITDSICDYFFTTSHFANENLLKENIKEEQIFFVGNTMIDCLKNNLNSIKKSNVYEEYELQKNIFFLMTLHRPSNVDNISKLEKILNSIDKFVGNNIVLFPVHPRTKKQLELINKNFNNIKFIEPQKYLEFIFLIKNSVGVITDSGGITEETTFLKIPCLTLRNSTERPETVENGTNILIGDNFELLESSIQDIISKKWKVGSIPELWDGFTSNRIIEKIIQIYESN